MEMEVVLGMGEEARPKPCSSEIESAEKTLKDDSNGQENGVRVSENGEQKLLGNSNGEDEKAKVETEKLNESGVIEDCVMNGVSSLLKLKQDKEIVEDEDEDEEEDDDDDDDDDDDEEDKYCVGDFVWGKIKNHPWWPGQIYDPSDASDLALKIKQKGKFLVAYFGDGTFAWCGASQLKPFAESFKECSKVSNSRSFLGAVEEAVEEIGRHIERVLVCDCAEEKPKFESRQVNNAGIKEGVLVHDLRREMISALLSGKHGEILKDVKGFAETVSFNGLLELEMLKRKVSAFYLCKRGYGLIKYHEPQSVPGLEDKNNSDDEDEDEDVDNGFEWRAERSSVKEVALDPEESVQRSLEKCSGFPDHRLHHKRKQKSIAEILENESAAKVRFETEPANGNVKSGKKKLKGLDEVKDELENVTTATPRRRKMSEVLTLEDAGHKKVGESSSKGLTVSRKMKKRDDDDVDGSGDREEIVKNDVSDPEIDIDSTPLASLRKRVRVDASSVVRSAGNDDTAVTQSSKRERKKSKYLSPEYLSDFSRKGRKRNKVESEPSKVSSQNQIGEQMTDASGSLAFVEEEKLDKPCEPSLDNGLGRQDPSEELSNAIDFLRLGATPMELRDLIRLAALGTQYPKDSSSRDMVREFMTIYRSFTYNDGANNKFLRSYESSDKEKEVLNETSKPEIKGKERKDEKLEAKQQAEETGKEENETTKKERKPKKSISKNQGEQEEETPKESSESTKKGRKRKKPDSKKQADEEEETRKESSESTKKERNPKKPKHEKEKNRVVAEKSEKKKKREGKSKEQKVNETEFSGAELFVTFGSGSSLPKKEDLIEIYEKFGALDKERTDMFYNNFSGRVAFLDVSDGEKAFESSQEKCPFASNLTVKFRLKYPNERTEEKKPEAEVAETTMEMEYVKNKLKEMKMLLDDCEGGMTEEVKVKLEGETVNFLEKVRKMRSS